MKAYSDPKRADDPYSLPDIEVLEVERIGCDYCDCTYLVAVSFVGESLGRPCGCSTCANVPDAVLTRCDLPEVGWAWWYCFPGCLPDGDPVGGPFATEAEALADTRGDLDDDEG